MTVRYEGPPPGIFYKNKLNRLLALLNSEATRLETELVENTPADRGRLRQGWSFYPATAENPVATVSQSVRYLLPVEMGRAPGAGISVAGQASVRQWARRVLGLTSPQEQQSFARALSRKYRRQGRPAAGFIGLARPGTTPRSPGSRVPDNPVYGSTLYVSFQRLRSRLSEIE